MRKFLILACFIVAFVSSAYTLNEIPNVHVADRTRYISNPDGLVSQKAQTEADSIMSRIWRNTSAEVVAVVVESIGDADANQFATELFSKWGIGKDDRDNGVLLLVVNDTHDVVIRTGYGAEGALPDIVSGRIIRDEMFPHFRAGDYDSAIITGLTRIEEVLSDPSVAEELKSELWNDARREEDEFSWSETFSGFAIWSFSLLIILLIILVIVELSTRTLPRAERYKQLNSLTTLSLVLTAAGFGIPILAYLLIKKKRNGLRDSAPICDLCSTPMKKLNQVEEQQYLSPQQKTEERIGSMEYDVWQCPADGKVQVESYPGKVGGFTVCDVCGAKACKVTGNYVLSKPTEYRNGVGAEETTCLHCGNRHQRRYNIAKTVAAPIVGGFGGFGGSGGGGFGGGSFGGGMTGGGGASGRW